MDDRMLKKALGLEGAVVTGRSESGGDVVVDAGPRSRAPRRPACGRRCDACGTMPPGLWRAPDLGLSRRFVRYAPARVECPGHGVRVEAVPWARCAASRMASAFGGRLAWCAAQMGEEAAPGLMRVFWRTVGSACGRACGEPLEGEGGSLPRGLRRCASTRPRGRGGPPRHGRGRPRRRQGRVVPGRLRQGRALGVPRRARRGGPGGPRGRYRGRCAADGRRGRRGVPERRGGHGPLPRGPVGHRRPGPPPAAGVERPEARPGGRPRRRRGREGRQVRPAREPGGPDRAAVCVLST